MGALGYQRGGAAGLCPGGRNPCASAVEPLEKTRPATIYMLPADEVKEFPKYEKLWKEIFQLR